MNDPSQPPREPEIAWGWLAGCVVAYGFVGVGVSVGNHGGMWAIAAVWAGAMAVAGAVVIVGVMASAVARVSEAVGKWAGTAAIASVAAVVLGWALAVAWGWVAAIAVVAAGVGLWRGSWELIRGWEVFFLGLWWVTWPLTLGLLPGLAADGMEGTKVQAIALPAIASWLGLALGVFIYRAVHPV
ncbi:MAG: hypothetical protein Fur0042_31270 [Cyanophyceae cyanobacterium]